MDTAGARRHYVNVPIYVQQVGKILRSINRRVSVQKLIRNALLMAILFAVLYAIKERNQRIKNLMIGENYEKL